MINFGAFIALSTVDWPGKSVCTVFFRGCPLRCSYCHNKSIQTGEDYRTEAEIIAMIASSQPLISGVVFSGGEPTAQCDALVAVLAAAKHMDLATCVQTNGFYPAVLQRCIEESLLDRVALDFKTRWEGFRKHPRINGGIEEENYLRNVRKSIAICQEAQRAGRLQEFEVVITLFEDNCAEVREIAAEVQGCDLVLQQGERKPYWESWKKSMEIDGVEFLTDRDIRGDYVPLSQRALIDLAQGLRRTVRVRTKAEGERVFEGNRHRRTSRKR
ncbi:MAG: anaerobic ribonucleoside-triphosphate reductase activating protein [Methanomicrobiales archaeon]|nr:anaerobic ribonucleoside-triphosphate reductase activating protein [Methanomicrobiales archaeon]